MKKIFTLLWLTITAFAFKATAQPGTNCNAEFAIQYINTNTVKFNPVITEGAPLVHHIWYFGDGTPVSNLVSPTHVYAMPGIYPVVHTIVRVNPNNVPVCTQTFTKNVVIAAACNMIADFNWSVTPTNPLRIEFHNLTTPVALNDSIRWTFGDGSSSNQPNPVHIYNVPGIYTVCLRVIRYNAASNIPCIREICKTVVAIAPPCNLVVDFNSAVTPTNPLRIEFNNLSVPLSPTDSVKWTFGDGTSSLVVNPVHIYTAPGIYTVCLTVKKHPGTINAPCIRIICKTIVITEPCTLVANFTSQPDPLIPLRIKFTNTSTPLNASDSVRWTFGDGTSISGLQSNPNIANPTHNYTSPGNYTVCIRVKKNNNSSPAGSCVREKCNTIVVTHPCNFPVHFSSHPDAVNPRKIYFTNLSTPPTAAATAVWTFGDGTSATSWNAVHEYAQPGTYRVCLKIYSAPNSNCVREFCDTIYIAHPAPPCNQLSKYHFEKFSNDNQKYKFTPDHINSTFQYTWTFGDGTGSHDPIAIHRYAQPGIYVACLTVWNGPNCASTTCKEIRVEPQINCDTSHVSYSYQRNPQVPNKISFYANGTLPILDQTWTITRLPGGATVTLHQNNPIYLFQDTGYYRVCLRAVMLGGCVKEYCNYIRIEHVANACTLQAFPNPASSTVNVNVNLTQPQLIHAYVYNSQNILVLDKHQQGYTGNNLISMQVNNLPAGHYTIRLIYGNSVCYASFQKL